MAKSLRLVMSSLKRGVDLVVVFRRRGDLSPEVRVRVFLTASVFSMGPRVTFLVTVGVVEAGTETILLAKMTSFEPMVTPMTITLPPTARSFNWRVFEPPA